MDNNNMYNQEQQNFQQTYQQPYQQPYLNENLEEPVTVGEWMLTTLIMLIPCVNIIMMFVFAFGNGKKSRANYFKASLIWMLIAIVLGVIFGVVFGLSMATLMY